MVVYAARFTIGFFLEHYASVVVNELLWTLEGLVGEE